jgi:hypothetical protein
MLRADLPDSEDMSIEPRPHLPFSQQAPAPGRQYHLKRRADCSRRLAPRRENPSYAKVVPTPDPAAMHPSVQKMPEAPTPGMRLAAAHFNISKCHQRSTRE